MLGISGLDFVRAFAHALLDLVVNPLLYAGWLLYAVLLGQEAKHQRRFFGVRLTRIRTLLWAQVWRSLLVGLILSAATCALGVVIRPWDVWFYSAIAVVLMACRLRFASSVSVIGLMVILATVTRSWMPGGLPASIEALWEHASTLPIYAWLCLAALLCFTEALLLFTRRRTLSHPVQVESKRGRVIGAVSVQLLFAVPVLAITAGSVPRPSVVASWPWLGDWAGGLAMIGAPFFLGMGGMFTSVKPRVAVRLSAWHSLSAGVLLGGAAALALWFPHDGWVGGIIALLSHEPIMAWYRRWESTKEPLYVPSPKGVRVLEVIGGSLAETLGIQPGEVITHVNQVPVHSEYDLHFAYSQNPAYAKLQVMDGQGEIRIVGGAVYDGERAKLGVVSVPDGLMGDSYSRSQFGLFQGLYVRLRRTSPHYDESIDPSVGT